MKNKNFLKNKLLNSNFFSLLSDKIKQSLQFELMFCIAICFLISFVFYNFTNNLLSHEYTEPKITYNYDSIKRNVNNVISSLKEIDSLSLKDEDKINRFINNTQSKSKTSKCYITDLDGKILFKSSNIKEASIDIYSLLKDSLSNIDSDCDSIPTEKDFIIPAVIDNTQVYVIYSETPEPKISYEVVNVSNSFFALLLTFIVFALFFVLITNKKMKYLDEIASGLKIIASGNLNYRIKERGTDEIKNIASNINVMAKEIGDKMNSERLAEKTKTDLITNVSHDLRTPLTSVMGYLGLVIDKRYKDETEMNEYLNIAFGKTERLKLLIQDLFEYTKLNNGGITLSKTTVNLSEFLSQLIEELYPILHENNLTVYKKFETEKLSVKIDSLKMLRVFENILTNAVKYSYKPGEIIIAIYEDNGYAMIVFRNKGKHIPKEKTDKLFDRFYRNDESRNSDTGGSGLGLAISKNIIELHGGEIWAESIGDNINFFIKLIL